MIIKKKTLLQSALSLTLFSTISVAADFYSEIEFKNTTPSLDTFLAATGERAECMTLDDLKAGAWNVGEICFATNIQSPITKLIDTIIKARVTSLKALGDGSTLGAECISDGGSAAASEEIGGFCLAADLNTSIADTANFSVANELPVAGMQFLQVLFKDGSTLGGSSPIGAECISSGGSASAPENAEGFCLASDLSRSTSAFANFAVANGLPVAGLQFVQVLFADGGGGSTSNTGTECVSIGGSTATTGATGGFCLASDLSTSTAGFANFSIAHDIPVSDLQFLQVTFADTSPSGGSFSSLGAGAPTGAECISVDGSIAAVDNSSGFCLVSDLINSSIDSAGMTIANNSPVSGMQFLQVKFANSGELPSSFASTAECVSDDGSKAAAGNPGGFCLVSDLINSTVESANISVANDLPVMSWEFLQVPSTDTPPLVGSNNPLGAGVPMGVVVSGFEEIPFIPTPDDIVTPKSPSILKDIVGNQIPFFHLSNQTDGIELNSTPYWRTYPNIGLWIGR